MVWGKNLIYLNVTEIAGACGQTSWSNPREIALRRINKEKRIIPRKRAFDVIESTNEEDCEKIITNLTKNPFTNDLIKEIEIRKITNPQKKVKVVVEKVLDTAIKQEKTTNATKIEKCLLESIKGGGASKIKEDVITDVSTGRGIHFEKRNIRSFSKNATFGSTEMTFANVFICEQYKLRIGGKIDAIEDDLIIETKKRRHKLFGRVRDYEKTQLMAYLHIFQKKRGMLIENFDGEQNKFELNWDENYWNQIVEKLKAYAELYLHLLSEHKKNNVN